MSDDSERLTMGHNMMNRPPGKRQIKPTAYLLNNFVLPNGEDEDVEFLGADKKRTVEHASDNSEEEGSDDEGEKDSEDSDDEYSSDDSDASSSNATDQDVVSDTENEAIPKGSICSVCLNQSEWARNETIIKCDKCAVSVHEGCYGGIFLEDSNGSNVESWFCEPCLLGVKEVRCELCPDTKGAFKLTEFPGQFIHMVCALFTENITWADNVNLLGASYQEVKHRLFGMKRCHGCFEEIAGRTGVASRCELGECNKYYHITCAQRLGLLIDRSDAEELPTHSRFVACKSHKKDPESIKVMKDIYMKFTKQENERKTNAYNAIGQVEEDRQNMKTKLVKEFQELQDISITKPDIHCNSSIRQRYARHIHTSARVLEAFRRKSLLFQTNPPDDNEATESAENISSEALDEQIEVLAKRNKKLISLKKKMEVEREKLILKHSKKEAQSLERKRSMVKELSEKVAKAHGELNKQLDKTRSSEEERSSLAAVLNTYGFPTNSFTFSEEPESNSSKDEKENPSPGSGQGKDVPNSPSTKRRKLAIEREDGVEGEVIKC